MLLFCHGSNAMTLFKREISKPISKPHIWINKIVFSDGSAVEFGRGDVVVIVGPNNSGKSATLKGIATKLADADKKSPVVRSISFSREGTAEEVSSWLRETTSDLGKIWEDRFSVLGKSVDRNYIEMWWERGNELGKSLSEFFYNLLDAEERLTAANPPRNTAIAAGTIEHPIHALQWNDAEEKRISDYFRRAFGVGIVVHRNAGNEVPLLLGDAPTISDGKDRVSIEYVLELQKLPLAHEQGDGMRSFLGVILFAAVGFESVLLIDEPEAFLHPPQAAHLGDFLVTQTSGDRQMFVATHSGDVLRGTLASGSSRVRVLRITRDGNKNIPKELKNSQIAQIWSDSLLRYSNILDGLFHERTILCEGDSDCRFYAAMADAIYESGPHTERKPDIMLTHCSGKDRMALVIRSLQRLGVPVSCIVDFDVLNAENPLRQIVEEAGGSWLRIAADWKVVKKAVDQRTGELSLAQVRSEIDKAMQSNSGLTLQNSTKEAIQEAMRRSSPWSIAKSAGMSFIPSGEASEAATRLLDSLESIGIHIVRAGQLESFVRTVGDHGPRWLAKVLQKDLKGDHEFQLAKSFVKKVLEGK